MGRRRSTEPDENIEFFCAEHAPKVDNKSKWEGKPLRFFVGKFVKRTFGTINPDTGKPLYEHMWVKVSGFLGDRLIGNLANDPAGDTELMMGDRVEVKVKEIEDVLTEPS